MTKAAAPVAPRIEAPVREATLSRVLDRVGRALIVTGLLMLGFVGYQLWGTGINEARQQDKLEQAFSKPEAATKRPDYGDAIGRISIPKLGVNKFVVAGTSWKALKKGPGLFTNSPLPCQRGNAALAGHRTTFGAPFGRIDELVAGDTISVRTATATCTYIVTGPARIVEPTAVEVIRTADPNRALLTLVSCHPKWTATKRIVVTAELAASITPQDPTPFVPSSKVSDPLSAGWFHDAAAVPAFILYGLALLLVVQWRRMMLSRGYRRSFSAIVLSPVFLVALYFFYENVARLLPTNL